MRITWCLAALLLIALSAPAEAITLAHQGRSAHVIVVADDAPAPEKHAARELQAYLKQVTGGAALPIVGESDLAGGEAPIILVGQTRRTGRLLPQLNWEALGEDGIVIKTAGEHLILAGGRPRGTLYAVYTFLEDHVGVRWWTSTESTIPHKPTLTIDRPLDRTYVPKFRYREVLNVDVMGKPRAAFAARLKLNGRHNEIPSEMGGHYSILGWCHTAFHLVPPEQHFAKHPEWFAEIDGKRQAGTQLCLTNREMQKVLIANALAQVRANPQAGIISVSQNDCYGPCQCDACQAVVTEEGSESGPWIRLCNAVAAEINREFPNFLVETLAYQYTRKPPKVTRPSKNVLVRLCSIECDFSHPLSGPSNQAFGDDLRGWKEIAPNLFIWNYVTNFANYLIPHPNLMPLADDLRFFADHNVVGVFEQGDYSNHLAGDFLPLRTWLLARLLWDPSQDQAALTQEFLSGYYGAAAAPHLAKYLQIINAPAKDEAFRMGCFNRETGFLSDEAIAQATTCFDDAAKAVADDQLLARRVRRERLALEHVRLLRYDFASAVKRHADDPAAARAEYVAQVNDWASAARELGVVHLSEAQAFNAYVPALTARASQFIPPTIPDAGAELGAGQFEIQDDAFRLFRPPALAARIDDAKASDGRAARMPGGHGEWAVQFRVPPDAPFVGPGPWECFLLVRVDAKANNRGAAFRFGLYDPGGGGGGGGGGGIAREEASLAVAGDGEYHAYGITVNELRAGMYFWVAPPAASGAVDAVYVDRIFIQRRASTGQENR